MELFPKLKTCLALSILQNVSLSSSVDCLIRCTSAYVVLKYKPVLHLCVASE